MQTCLDAVQAYFDTRNRAWITGDVEAMMQAAGLSQRRHGIQVERMTASIERLRRSMARRGRRLLRAHSNVTVRHLGQAADGTRTVRVDEHVIWVYADGRDYDVEARLIRHNQQWAQHGGVWVLVGCRESSEGAPVEDVVEDASSRLAFEVTVREERRPKEKTCVQYDRLRAMRYAELWWNGWNPQFPRLSDDCTNFISQCLWAGRMPMKRARNRGQGWWCRLGAGARDEAWSYSWTTSQALFAYLTKHVGAHLVGNPQELKIGDLVFYDWTGQGKYHHTTIVVDFDGSGHPLVSAHTDSSYRRHYQYSDSRAWTPRTTYRYVRMPDTFC
ncbi:hypothetical protein GCM10025857_15650 [Alicyclobacillus contaminans]|uniref:amidase domain-containing protein n=1 Tax=Alicyclobacillus contaminans TaxID=392016 RepID=UPI0003F8278C|nr:amidase domain-containing protein [Alicyclobacillus contaminans]GMA50208.1 hypothetical protein GCM10025857_15650 [Alicyclobacillus contaminans]